MISLILPPRSQLSQAQNMLASEYGTACVVPSLHLAHGSSDGRCILYRSNIKSRVNRLSVLAAITSTQQRLKLYTRVGTP